MTPVKKLVILGVLGGGLIIPPNASTPLAQQEVPEKHAAVGKASTAQIQRAYGNLPLSFIQNKGQVDQRVLFYEQGSGHATSFMKDGISLSLVNRRGSETIKLVAVGGNKKPTILGEGLQEGTVNYFVGRDHTKWRSGIPTYHAVVYQEIYPGIDLKFYGTNRQLEYDVIVKPGADPSTVRLAYEGVEALRVTEAGDLEIRLKGSTVLQKKPVVYQDIDGKRVAVSAQFKVLEPVGATSAATAATRNEMAAPAARQDPSPAVAYTFEVASYDRNHALVIDPTLVYATFLGGSGDEDGEAFGLDWAIDAAIEADALGYAYVTGSTTSLNIGVDSATFGARGAHDVFVAKLNPAGTGLVYATYLGGSGYDGGHAITVDPQGNAYLTGETTSPDFPTTDGAYQRTCGTDTLCNGGRYDAFVVKLNRDGTGLVYSTYLGGSGQDAGHDIQVNARGNAYVIGTVESDPPDYADPGFPTTPGAFDEKYNGSWGDAFVAQLTSDGTGLVYSTYLGGSGGDVGGGIALDAAGNAYLTGDTLSPGLATVSAYDLDCGTVTAPCSDTGKFDGYVAKLNAAGSALEYFTYLGGSEEDRSIGIDLLSEWKVYVTGRTSSSDFPTTPGAFDTDFNGGVDQFVVALNTFGFFYATFLGGEGIEDGHNLVVDPSSGSVYVNGGTTSADFPTTLDAYDRRCGTDGTCDVTRDGYLVKLRLDNTLPNDPCEIAGRRYNDCADLSYSTYLGGSGDDIGHGVAVDGWGNVYATGRTSSKDFPNFPPSSSEFPDAYGRAFNGGATDAFVAKFGRTPAQTKAEADALPIIDLHFHGHPDWARDPQVLVDVFDEVGVVRACNGGVFPFAMDDSGAPIVDDRGVLDFETAIDAIDSGRYIPYGGMDVLRKITFDDKLDLGDANAGTLSANMLTYLSGLEANLRLGRFSGIGELFPNNQNSHPGGPDTDPFSHPSVYPADSPLMQRLWALSAAFQIPLNVHMEATQASVAQMERLLDMEFDGRKGIWIWAHAGFYDNPSGFWELPIVTSPDDSFFDEPPAPSPDSSPIWFNRLLERHPNLYVELSYRDLRQGGFFGIVDDSGMLKPDWKALLEQYSHRFVIGTDVDAPYPKAPKAYAGLITFWRGILAQLSPEARANIAHGNADRHSLCEQRNTPVGSNVQVSPDSGMTVTFASVTVPGKTTVTTNSTGPTPPAGFQLGDPPTYYDITTTAAYTAPVTVCLNYDPVQYSDPTALRLLHYEADAWTDVTTTNDTTTNMICGEVSSLSPFIVAEPVADTTPPVLTVPGTITTNATSPAGAVVSYSASATDNRDSAPGVTCTPSSGSTFPIGTTTVTCMASDVAGNSASVQFQVIVQGAPEQIAALVGLVQSFNLKQGIENSLDAKLQNAQDALTAAQGGDLPSACNLLNAFSNEAQAQSGKAITPDQASQLNAAANQVTAVLGCL
ncbi:MAG: SBBP repeat-containing protein [Nitrospirota bacterium]